MRRLQDRGRWLDTFMVGTDLSLPESDNVELVQLMEEETIRMAAEKGYSGVITVNAHPATVVS